MMNNKELIPELNEAVESGSPDAVRQFVSQHPTVFTEGPWLQYFLNSAACDDNLSIVSLLVDEYGADIHAPNAGNSSRAPEGVIYDASGCGAINVVRWLLERGAQVNYDVGGVTRCVPLSSAVREGQLDVVKLLVEHGADINAVWAGNNALSFAIMYGQKEIEDYLRSKGALEPWQITGETPPKPEPESESAGSLLEHFEKHLGKANPLALREIVACEPSITIHVIPQEDRLVLVTTGMSDRPMTVPDGQEDYCYAELFIQLPRKWPLSEKALRKPENFWPIEWLRRIALYPHLNHTWLGGFSAIFANGEPPKSLAPNTKLSCVLAVVDRTKLENLRLPDGRLVLFYRLFPLYTEERNLERREGLERLFYLFEQWLISSVVGLNRGNVAIPPRYRKLGEL